ncbi:MAG: S41 family peptidase, partial [Chitinophagaceae bacterium]|nr:S41 family peptidase [Chitinophagaceae bacterium]
MMKKVLLVWWPVILGVLGVAAQNNTCNCAENLEVLINKTSENYAGFPAKVNTGTRPEYEKLVSALKSKAATVNSPKACFYILKNYIRFFADKHFILSYTDPKDYVPIVEPYGADEMEEQLRRYPHDKLLGKWRNADSTLVLGLKKTSDSSYKGIVLYATDSTIPAGLVYLTLSANGNTFIAKTYDSYLTTDAPALQKGQLLQLWSQNLLGKVYPNRMSIAEEAELDTWKNQNNGLQFRQLSGKTACIKIPTFLNNDDKIQQLIAQNHEAISKSENLIVDLTGNGGGNSGWVALLPYFITKPIVQPSPYLRITPENVKHKMADMEFFVKNPIPDDYKKYFPDSTVLAYKKAYEQIQVTQQPFYPIPTVTFPLEGIMTNPRKIALLVDDFCGSSAEYFFFLSRQSAKTTTYGINTLGMM